MEWKRTEGEGEEREAASGSKEAGEREECKRKGSLRGGEIGSEGRGRGVEMLGRGRLSQGKQ